MTTWKHSFHSNAPCQLFLGRTITQRKAVFRLQPVWDLFPDVLQHAFHDNGIVDGIFLRTRTYGKFFKISKLLAKTKA